MMQSSGRALRVENVCKVFQEFTLKAHFEVNPGERVILWGRSGVGKTSLLQLIAGLIPMDRDREGQIFLGEENITTQSPQKRNMGFVFQDQALFADLSVAENAAFGLKVRGVPPSERRQIIEDWLKRVGLSGFASKKASQLSIGERQRVAFIRAVCWQPRVILLDEPFAALDGETRRILREELLALHELWPAPVLMVTHDEEEAQILGHGRLIFHSDPQDHARSVTRELTKGAGFD